MNTRRVVRIAVIAALYTVLTIGLAPISYGVLQFRVSEALKIFVLFDPFLSLGIGIGTFFANMASPMVGPWELAFMPITDILGGMLAYAIFRLIGRRWPWLPMIVYAITTGAAVGLMLQAFGLGGFWFLTGTVALSEAVILIGGLPILLPVLRFWQRKEDAPV